MPLTLARPLPSLKALGRVVRSAQQSQRTRAVVLLAEKRRNISTRTAARAQEIVPPVKSQEGLDGGRYFWANEFKRRIVESKENVGRYGHEGKRMQEMEAEMAGERRVGKDGLVEDETTAQLRPRARRKRAIAATAGAATDDGSLPELPHDASAQLSHMAASSPTSLKKRFFTYLALTKPRLAFLVVLTSAAGYSLYPVPSLLSTTATETPSLSGLTLLFLTVGTFGTIASANTLNMLFEPAYDAQMSRTRNRPLVRKLISPRNAYLFALASAVAGTSILWYGVNPTTAVLGSSNIILYAFIYTPLKRISTINTWIGAVVGAVPPLMGWCAAGGQYATATPSSYRSFPTSSSPDPALTTTSTASALWDEMHLLLFTPSATGGWLLAALLFAWQFPHFNALSHPIRHEYRNAGYKMLVWYHAARNTRVALRYAVAMFPICAGLTAVGVTDKWFLGTSSVVNAWMVKEAWGFYRSGGGESKEAAKAARALFWASVWHLPIVLLLAMCQKQGLWEGVWRSVVGGGEVDEEGEWEEDDD